ncbi:MAG TPA: hypothetical protein VFE16_11960 [Candidatus Cybelea sp.]|jgi:hypothetical protein|nr:hypothetical protein [Candidatus Cybelea sp.]
MSQIRRASLLLPLALVLACTVTASAQVAYNWTKYTLNGYGGLDVGYLCDNGRLMIAVHGEAKGTLSVAFGDDAAQSFSFDGSNAMGPNGYYAQNLLQKPVQCDNRGSWPIISVTSNGTTLKIRWE